jgi:RNA polymerase sigma-70 factor, ECF subfamily
MPSEHAPGTFEAELMGLVPRLMTFARSLSGSEADAEDLTQETIAKALKSRSSYQTGTSMRSWLYTILHNRFRTEKRHSWRALALDPKVAATTLRAVDNAEAIVTLKEVRQAIASLTPQHEEILVLIGGAGLSYDEAAEVLGLSVGTVKSRLSRARSALAAVFLSKMREEAPPAPARRRA